jgi:glycine dehydrogenase
VKRGANKFFVDKNTYAQTIDLLKTRSAPLNIEIEIGDYRSFQWSDGFFGCVIQYPNSVGEVCDYQAFTAQAHAVGAGVAVGTDLLALALLTPPGEWGADVVFGNSQRFGVPMGFGGPHAAFFATREDFKRLLPGRIIGVSVDSHGKPALRMALQTREQHIKRDKATSNICTAQALLAIMAGMYAVYHGPSGVKTIADDVHQYACTLSGSLKKAGLKAVNTSYFDTISFEYPAGVSAADLKKRAEAAGINLFYRDTHFSISIDQTFNSADLNAIVNLFTAGLSNETSPIQGSIARTSTYLTHPVFNSYHSETEMMRYIKRLENKDLSLVHSMISLGSCTMKLNAAA